MLSNPREKGRVGFDLELRRKRVERGVMDRI
jgi:hypothetical protein